MRYKFKGLAPSRSSLCLSLSCSIQHLSFDFSFRPRRQTDKVLHHDVLVSLSLSSSCCIFDVSSEYPACPLITSTTTTTTTANNHSSSSNNKKPKIKALANTPVQLKQITKRDAVVNQLFDSLLFSPLLSVSLHRCFVNITPWYLARPFSGHTLTKSENKYEEIDKQKKKKKKKRENEEEEGKWLRYR